MGCKSLGASLSTEGLLVLVLQRCVSTGMNMALFSERCRS